MSLLKIVLGGDTDVSVNLTIIDSSDGTRETGVVYNTSGIDLWYRREGAAKVSITEADLTTPALTDSHEDGGFLHIGDGVYRLDVPDAAFAAGAAEVEIGGSVTGMIVIGGTVQIDAPVDVVRISGDSAAADNLEAAADGTGYNLGGGSVVAASVSGNVSGSVGSLATQAKADVNAESDAALSDAGVTSARMGYVDNLNIGENVAGTSEVTAIQNNTKAVRVVPTVIERPDSGSMTYRVELLLYDDQGNMEAPDSAPTLDLVDESGNSRTSRLDSTTGTLVSAGRYRWVYTATDSDDLEQLLWTFSVVEGGATRLYGNGSLVVDTTAVDFTAADRAKLDTLHDTRIPGVIQPQTGDAFQRLGAPSGASLSADLAAVPTADENAAALLDLAAGVETGMTVREFARLAASALFGKSSGDGTVYRDINDTKDRINATMSGKNRTAVSTDAT